MITEPQIPAEPRLAAEPRLPAEPTLPPEPQLPPEPTLPTEFRFSVAPLLPATSVHPAGALQTRQPPPPLSADRSRVAPPPPRVTPPPPRGASVPPPGAYAPPLGAPLSPASAYAPPARSPQSAPPPGAPLSPASAYAPPARSPQSAPPPGTPVPAPRGAPAPPAQPQQQASSDDSPQPVLPKGILSAFFTVVIIAVLFILGGSCTAFPFNTASNLDIALFQGGVQQSAAQPENLRVLAENDLVTVAFTGNSVSHSNGTVFEITIENRSDTKVYLRLSKVKVNGSSNTYIKIDDSKIPSQSIHTGTIYIENVSSLRNLTSIIGTLEVYDALTDERIGSYPFSYSYRLSV